MSTVPIALRGSPDGASIRSESPIPSCESQENDDNINELHFQQQPRLMSNTGSGTNHPPPYPRHIQPYNNMGINQLPQKLAPPVNVVLRRNQGNYIKGANNKQRHSLPPPPSYTSHLASTSIEQRKEIALSGHDWTQRNSDIFNDSEANSRPTSEYDSDCWRGKILNSTQQINI